MAEEIERFGASIERGLLERFDAQIEQHGYASRSAALSDLMRASQSDAAALKDPAHPAMGTLTMFYDHGRKDLADRLQGRPARQAGAYRG